MPFSLFKKSSIPQKNVKKIEQEEQRKQETEQFENKILEQDDVIHELKLKLVETEKAIERVVQDRDYLLEDRNKLENRLQEAAEANTQHASMTSLLQDDLSRMKEQLALEELNHREKQQLEERLQMSLSISEQTSKNYEVDKSKWKRVETTFEAKIDKITQKYNEAKQEVVDHEKTINQLRADRNHREAVMSKLEKDLESMEDRRKEVEVEVNRTRQQLTESKQKYSKLEEEVIGLRRTKKDLGAKLNSVKLYECTELEKKKIDSMKTQLETLCKHIQESEKKYNETISAYRGHLLMAAKGELNPDVLAPLREILKLQEEPDPHDQL